MAKYLITGPGGQKYEIGAPDGATDQEVRSFAFKSIAEGMDPTDLSVARSKNDEFGAYLRAQASAPREGETKATTFQRQYGSLGGGPQVPGAAEGMTRGALQGATFGLGDEIVAAGAATIDPYTGNDGGTWDERYTQRLGNERRKLAGFRSDSPVLAYGSEIAGAIPTAAVIPLGALGRAAQAGPIAQRIASGATIGGLMGGAAGFGAGEGEGGRAKSAAEGAAIGGIVGGAVPAVTAGVENIAARVAYNQGGRDMGLDPTAARVLGRVMSADDALTGAGSQRLQNIGPGAMMADAGPTARTALDTTVQRSGEASRIARDAIENRAAQAGQRIGEVLDDALGPAAGIKSTERAIRTGSAAARGTAYDAAYAQPINYASETGQQIERVIRDRVPMSAIRAANNLMRVEGERSAQIMARVGENGRVVFERMPDVRQIDYITRGLNEVADKADGLGKIGGQTQTGRAYSSLSRELRGLTRQAVPEYATALDTAAEPIAARQALQVGNKVLSPGMTRDDVAEAVRGMSAAERAMVARGIRSQIDDALANVRAAMTDTNMDAREAVTALKGLSSRAAREKVETVIGADKASRLFAELDRASAALELRAGVATNSRTYARQSMDEMIANTGQGSPVEAIREGRPINAVQRITQIMLRGTPEARAARSDKTYADIARALTGPRGDDARRVLEGLSNIEAGAVARQQLSPAKEAILRAMMAGSARGGGFNRERTR